MLSRVFMIVAAISLHALMGNAFARNFDPFLRTLPDRARPYTPTRAKRDAFLDAYTHFGTVCYAAHAANIGRQTHYDWIEKDPRLVTVRKFSDRLLEQLAKAKCDEMTLLDVAKRKAWPARFARGVSGRTPQQ